MTSICFWYVHGWNGCIFCLWLVLLKHPTPNINISGLGDTGNLLVRGKGNACYFHFFTSYPTQLCCLVDSKVSWLLLMTRQGKEIPTALCSRTSPGRIPRSPSWWILILNHMGASLARLPAISILKRLRDFCPHSNFPVSTGNCAREVSGVPWRGSRSAGVHPMDDPVQRASLTTAPVLMSLRKKPMKDAGTLEIRRSLFSIW